MRPLDSLLQKLLQTTCKIPDWHIELLHAWPTIMGSLASKISLNKIEGSTLLLGVSDTRWMHELHMLSKTLQDSINKHLGRPYITCIKLIPTYQRSVKSPPPPIKKESPSQTFMPSSTHEEALLKISDEKMRESLYKLLTRCKK